MTIISFCNGLGNQTCTFLYPDYPDIPLLHLKINKTSNNNTSCENCILGPTSCGDLKIIGHQLRGFYMIRLNANKVKVVYCDFNEIQMIENGERNLRSKRSTSKMNGTTPSKNTLTVCKGVGSQPCSCYFSNFRDILQFEMSDDEITRSAMQGNGTGPETCEELKEIGYKLDGFYMLRFNSTLIKTAFCKLHETKEKIKKKKKKRKESTTVESTTSTLPGKRLRN